MTVTLAENELRAHMQAHHDKDSSDPTYHGFLHQHDDKTDHIHGEDGQPVFDGKHVEPPYVLKYGEDIKPGDRIMDIECDDDDQPSMPSGPFAILMGGAGGHQHNHKYGSLLVMEVRSKDELHFAGITVNEEGKQEPVYFEALRLIKVVVTDDAPE